MKIFDREPKKGMPVGNKTMLVGLLRMARAWEKLAVHNGHIDWSNGIPTIVVDAYYGQGVEGDTFDYPGRVYVDGGDTKVTSVPCNFWTGGAWNSTTKSEDGTNTWGELTSEYVYIQLDISSATPAWSLSHNATNPLSSDSQTQRSWLLASIDADGVITQHWMGAIYETMGG